MEKISNIHIELLFFVMTMTQQSVRSRNVVFKYTFPASCCRSSTACLPVSEDCPILGVGSGSKLLLLLVALLND